MANSFLDRLRRIFTGPARPDPTADNVAQVDRDKARLIWWGRFDFADDEAGQWRIGPSKIAVQRHQNEWRIVQQQVGDSDDDALSFEVPTVLEEELELNAKVRRYMFRQTAQQLVVTPMLADRPVIIRPKTPFAVQDGQEVTMYVSTPLWVRFEVGNARSKLYEVPTYRPSDTWFGSSTLSGELCYASASLGHVELENVPRRPYRAISPIRIRNRSREPLVLERVKLPTQYLSLYRSDEDYLWTQAVILNHEQDDTVVQLGRGAPRELSRTEVVSGPRERMSRRLSMRSFGGRFRSNREVS